MCPPQPAPRPTAVLVPASGDLRTKHLGPSATFFASPALLPVGSRLAVDLIRGFYQRVAAPPRLYLATDLSALPQADLRPFSGFTVLDVGRTASICETIARAVPRVEADFLVVNPVTSIPSACLTEEAAILLGDVEMHQERWSSVALDAAPAFRFRDATPPGSRGFPFTGILSSSRAAIARALERVPEGGRSDLLHLAHQLHLAGDCGFVHAPWIDAGHRATYALSKRLCLPSRAFNTLTYAADGDLIVKRSGERERLRGEGQYLESLPPALRRHFPCLHASRPDDAEGWVLEQEFIPFPTLAETFLHWDVGPNAWERIVRRLRSILEDFARSAPPVRRDCGWLYGGKARARLELLERQLASPSLRPLRPILEDDVRVNGRSFPSLSRSVELLVERLAPLERDVPLQRIHGDLCFNNILCDPLFGVVKLIDPRGAESEDAPDTPGLGDPRYDLAKLNHSFLGLYDSIANNLFALRGDPGDLRLSVYAPPDHAFLLGMFRDEVLAPRLDRATCDLLTASLFLSMLPLHSEDPERMLALMAVGLALLHDGSMEALRRPGP